MSDTIQKTTDYTRFQNIKGNRELNQTNLKNIMRSILELDLLQQNPIQVNENLQVVDGQHRLEVAKRLQIPIYYTIVDGGNLRDVIRLNNARRIWSSKDYLESHIELGNQNYVILKDFMKEYQMRLSVAVGLLMGHKVLAGGGHLGSDLDLFRKGDFKAKEIKYAEDMANNLQVMEGFAEDDSWKERAFVAALQETLEKVEFRELIRQFEASKMRISHKKNTRIYLRFLEEVVSFKKQKPIRLF